LNSSTRNVAALAVCQGLLVTNNIAMVSLGSLAGYQLATAKTLSTLPGTAYIVGGALSAYPVSHLMRRYGRRAGFTLGALAGLAGSGICTLAMALHSFWLFCLGALIAGMYTATGGYYRFAAADGASDAFKSQAISLVLAGGMIGGVLGPESSKLTRELLSVTFLASYAALMLFALAALAVIRLVDLPPPAAIERSGATRRLGAIVRQPVFVVACLGAVTSYAIMNLLMGATPLAMQMCKLPYAAAALVIEWHILGMYVPALIAGRLVHRFGALRIMGAGVAAYLACVFAALSGVTVLNFWLHGTLLGVGWCLLYVGASSLLLEAYAPPEKAKTQGINDALVFVVMALSSVTSGAILYRFGWNILNLSALPLLLLTAAAVGALASSRRAAPQRVAAQPSAIE
jgi:MFS family permease